MRAPCISPMLEELFFRPVQKQSQMISAYTQFLANFVTFLLFKKNCGQNPSCSPRQPGQHQMFLPLRSLAGKPGFRVFGPMGKPPRGAPQGGGGPPPAGTTLVERCRTRHSQMLPAAPVGEYDDRCERPP